MFERFSPESRAVLELAAMEAARLSSPEVEPEHFLAALLRKCTRVAAQLSSSLPEGYIREHRAMLSETRRDMPWARAATFSLTSKRVLAYGAAEAERAGFTGYGYIEPEHILLGIAAERESSSAKILCRFGLDLPSLRALLTG